MTRVIELGFHGRKRGPLRLAGNQTHCAEPQRPVRHQRTHVEREPYLFQVREVTFEPPPVPSESLGAHPTVDLWKKVGAVAEKRSGAQTAVPHDLGSDALGQATLQQRKPIFGRPSENQIAV